MAPMLIVIIIKLYFSSQPIDKNIQIHHGKIYTVDSKFSVMSIKKEI